MWATWRLMAEAGGGGVGWTSDRPVRSTTNAQSDPRHITPDSNDKGLLKSNHKNSAWFYVLSKSEPIVTTSRKASQPLSCVNWIFCDLVIPHMCPPQSP